MSIKIRSQTTASIFYQIDVVGRNGRVLRKLPRKRNLILNGLLDYIGAGNNWRGGIGNVAVGTGSLTTKRASGATTITATSGNLVSSAGFFTGADVGRILQLDSGEKYLIATAPTTTTATSTNLTSAAASPGTIHYVNLTGLVTETERSSTVSVAMTSTWSGGLGTMTHSIALLTPLLATARVYSEIGWSWNSGAGQPLAGCAQIAPSVSLGVGQRLRVTISLVVKPTPIVSTPVSAGLAVGNCLTELIGFDVGRVHIREARLGTAATALAGPSTSSDPAIGTLMNSSTATFVSYTNGTYKRVCDFEFSDSLGAITANSLRINYGANVGGEGCSFRVLLTSPLVKTANDRVNGSIEYSWDRELVN